MTLEKFLQEMREMKSTYHKGEAVLVDSDLERLVRIGELFIKVTNTGCAPAARLVAERIVKHNES